MRGDERTRLAPSALAAVGLHVAVLVSGLIAWPWLGKPVQVANVTAITLSPAPSAPPPPALKAPETQTAAAPEPTPKPEPPKPPPPKPQPAPTPPKPTPPPPKVDPKGIPKPQPKPKTKEPDFLSSLTTSLDKTAAKSSAAAKGPPRLETAPVARPDPGAEQATNDAFAALKGRIQRLWIKNCGVEGFRDLVINVQVHLTPDGNLQGAPKVIGSAPPGNTVWQAAADSAVRAAIAAAPYSELPRQTYGQWKGIVFPFDGKQACQN